MQCSYNGFKNDKTRKKTELDKLISKTSKSEIRKKVALFLQYDFTIKGKPVSVLVTDRALAELPVLINNDLDLLTFELF